ncbi:MAG: hypothetical protein QXZ48_06820 [Zestosphaera sp.]
MRGRGNAPETGRELNPAFDGDVALNLPRTLTLQGGEEVRDYRLNS